MGCACKLEPQKLEEILKDIPHAADPDVLVDTRYSDDAAVYRINETTALVQTVDFFTLLWTIPMISVPLPLPMP